MADKTKLDRDPQRRARAEAIKAVTDVEWSSRQGATLEKVARRTGEKLVISQAPEYILDADGEIVGIDAWVQLFDARGRELPIDPHRRIINPPMVPRSGIREGANGRSLTPDPLAAFWEAVQDSVESVPNEKGWRTRGTVTTVFAGTGDGQITSGVSSSYATVAAGSSLAVDTTGTVQYAGQFFSSPNYTIQQVLFGFDTSAIADGDVVSAVTLSLRLMDDSSTTDFTTQAREFDWSSGGLTTADWRTPAQLNALTLLASISSSGIGATGAYKALTSQAAFLTATNMKTGTVYIHLSSDRNASSTTPPNQETLGWQTADAAGTTSDPKLDITHATPPTAMPFFTSRPNRIWSIQ